MTAKRNVLLRRSFPISNMSIRSRVYASAMRLIKSDDQAHKINLKTLFLEAGCRGTALANQLYNEAMTKNILFFARMRIFNP